LRSGVVPFKQIVFCIALALANISYAADRADDTLPDIEVIGEKVQPLPALNDSALGETDLYRLRSNTSDSAKLLKGQPGVSFFGAGGVSSMPVIHGMADDRVRVKIDGMDLISACANHMNTPLSYIDPANVDNVNVFAGIAPVSIGGDSLGGTIKVDSAPPEFAKDGQGTLSKGQITALYRSNNQAKGGNLSATIANEALSMRYTGSTVSANNYTAGATFKSDETITGSIVPGTIVAGDEVGSSRYRAENHALGFALRHENHLVDLKLGLQSIPYQGFPNQRMDMTSNDSKQINLRYIGQYDWGALEARAYNEHTLHSMNFLEDKTYWYGAGQNVPGMPMDTDGKNTGARVNADIIVSDRDIFRVGGEYQRYRLNDYWSPSANSPMMTPDTFWNINNGQRDRLDVFAEWEANWNSLWVSQLGLRSGTVKMDTGAVQGYNAGVYGAAANAFNALSHQRTDNNIDLTVLARYTPDEHKTFEVGFAQKTRSPNLHERFVWANSNTMVMNMNNWVGDGNGYVGNLNLKPEVANTLSATGNWHDDAQKAWELKISPYYTRVNDYIDAVDCATIGLTCPARSDGFVNLSLSNQSARLHGVDVSGKMLLAKTNDYGSFSSTGVLSYLKGKNLTTGDNLYNIMPLNMKLAIEQRVGKWTNTIEAKLVDAKTDVQTVRKELKTGGYGLLNLYSSYEWKQVRLDVGVENLFNKFYSDPLGGAYVGQGDTMGTGVPYGISVPGMGRSINTSLTMKF